MGTAYLLAKWVESNDSQIYVRPSARLPPGPLTLSQGFHPKRHQRSYVKTSPRCIWNSGHFGHASKSPRTMNRVRVRYLIDHPGLGVDDWVAEESRFFLDEFIKFVQVARRDTFVLNQILSFLSWFFSPTLTWHPPIGSLRFPCSLRLTCSGIFWDADLVYFDERDHFVPTCVPAAKAIMSYWASAQGALPPLSTISVQPDCHTYFTEHTSSVTRTTVVCLSSGCCANS